MSTNTYSPYPNTQLHINGAWRDGVRQIPVLDPATEAEIGHVHLASEQDLSEAAEAAARAFGDWRRVPALERGKLMHRAAQLLRERAQDIAVNLTREQGKTLGEARGETLGAADTIDWFAEEASRTYGRLIPSRVNAVRQSVVREPVGPVAAFTPWNFPINQVVRKVSAALATGCTVVLKAPEETPASCAALVKAFVDAGLPAGALNLVFGIPADVSSYLIAHPAIRKISFTGSTPVGKQLAALAGQHMKRATMELGGHAPVLVFADAPLEMAAKQLARFKAFNAGQVCISPTRFMVEDAAYDEFVSYFVAALKKLRVGSGLDETSQMGPLANPRRIDAMERLVADARAAGAKVLTGGERVGDKGWFYAPTALADVPLSARIMTEEPFGPIAPISRFSRYEDAVAEANRLPYGLAAYAFTTSSKTSAALARDIESGMLSINHFGLALPETPFGGVKDSGYGSEGGPEALDAYMVTRFVTELVL